MNKRIKKKKLDQWAREHVKVIEFSTERVGANIVRPIVTIKIKKQEHD